MNKQCEITLNKNVYPLYVGGSAAEKFRDWDGKGSSVLLETDVYSETFGLSDVVWSIDNTEIADFDFSYQKEGADNGKRRVRARRTGVTAVNAKLPNGSCAQCFITVIDNYSRLTVSKIELNTQELLLQTGKKASLIPILYPKDIYQNGMLDTTLIWESTDERVALVTDGEITAVGNGETDIVVCSAGVNRVAVCHIKVSDAVTGSDRPPIVTAQTREMLVGECLKLPEGDDIKQPVWQTDNRYIADVDEHGQVTAYSASIGQKVDESGMVVQEIQEVVWIYATDMEDGSVIRYPVRVNRIPQPIHQMSISPANLSIPIGGSRNITATVNTPVPRMPPVIWESSNKDILTVSPTEDTVYGTAQAIVTAHSVGESVVTASIGDKKACCNIIITQDAVKVERIHIDEQKEIDIDQVFRFKPTLPENTTNKIIHWVGTDSTVATLDREGNVQGYHPGTIKIYAIADDSLSHEQKNIVKKVYDNRMIPLESNELQKLLAGVVYSECVLQVRDGNPALRNLHVVEESQTDHSLLLLWNRASLLDTGEFDRYIILCDGSPIAETRKLGYRAENLTPSTMYEFQVTAVDRDGAPLSKATIKVVTRKKSEVINVLNYGAAGNGSRMDTFFIQKAIDECPKGGTVLLPENHVFLSGALFLKSDMTFQVDGIMLGSSNPKDYPRVITKWEGWRKLEQTADSWENSMATAPVNHSPHVPITVNHCPHASLLNAGCYDEGEKGSTGPYNLENLVICGKGQINADGFILAYNEGPNGNTSKVAARDYPVKDATSRGSAIRIHNGRNIYLKDVQVAYAPGWTIHTIYCDHITFDGMEIVSQGDGDYGLGTDILNCGHIFNGDGIDPESCVYANLFDIFFTTGDDAVAIKSGRNQEGNELDKPNAYIRVTDCTSKWSLGGFGTGSETAGGSHDLLFQNLVVEDVLISGIWLKTCTPRGGITENIQVRDLKAEGCNSPVWVYNNYSNARVHPNPSICYPIVRHLIFENAHGKENNELGFRLEGSPECMIQNVQLRGISSGGKENKISFCEKVSVIL